jgi:hypothetical protein
MVTWGRPCERSLHQRQVLHERLTFEATDNAERSFSLQHTVSKIPLSASDYPHIPYDIKSKLFQVSSTSYPAHTKHQMTVSLEGLTMAMSSDPRKKIVQRGKIRKS